MLADRHPLRRKWQQAQRLTAQGKSADKLMREIQAGMQRSQARMAARKAALPTVSYPPELPVSTRKAEIASALMHHQVVIVCGETGSGKTTQLPKICLELGRGVAGLIGHTQPRRIAARSVATRIAQELGSPLGQAVGYKVRFNDKLSESTYIKLMTDGILLAETQGDGWLNAYDTLIIDEAHERSLNIDFLLGYLKQLLPKRPDLKVIVTSATIDAERFSRHFMGAPVIEVSGRTYPVEIRYRPLGKAGFTVKEISPETTEDSDDFVLDALTRDLMGVKRKARTEARWLEEDAEEEALEEAILDTADDLLRLGDGDILVFLPGEREIRDTAEHLRKYQGRSAKLKSVEILPLFARLSIEDQQRIFRTGGQRRIVLATNVAETSLTVPGIKYVIDSGLARVNRYSPRAKVEQLQIEKISQAAARQRAGRCGRVSHGICVRLYAEEDYNSRPAFTDPEILRSSLASVILRMAALRLGDVADFPFLEAPSSRLIADGYLLLQELGAVDAQRQITEHGRQLARLPLDPRVGRMLLAAQREGCLTEMLIIASVLSIQDPRERPMEKREAADQTHAKFVVEGSDFMGYLKLWDWFDHALKSKKSNRDLLNQCHQQFLSFLRLKEWRELHQQLQEMIEEILPQTKQAESLSVANAQTHYAQIHRALLAGLLGNIGFKDGESESYAGARGIRFHIAPGSALKKNRPKWVMAAELVDTSKLYARGVAKIEPDWIEPLARGLTQSHYSDPRWDRRQGMVIAWERVSLYGLTIVPQRRVHYGPINPDLAREIFIREALANHELDTRAPFMQANLQLIAEVQALEHKARRQDVLVDEQQLFDFYNSVVPAINAEHHIYNAASFEKWRASAETSQPKLLYLTRETLMRHSAQAVTEVQFPEALTVDGISLALKYRFEPGHVLDGVTATVPLALLNQLDPSPCEWLVPGMIRDKLAALIKALPKTLRRVCVPVPDFVTRFLQTPATSAPLLPALTAFIQQETSLRLSPSDFDLGALDAHHLMNFRIVDTQGQELAMGRDWHALKKQLGSAAQLTFRSQSPDHVQQLEKSGLKQWDFGDLPESLSFSQSGRQMTGYPGLEDHSDSVSIKLFDTAEAAMIQHRQGVVRLLRMELKEQMKQLEKGLPGFNQYALQLRQICTPETLRDAMLSAIADRAFVGEDALPRNNADFMKLKQRARTRLPAVSDALARLVQAIATEYPPLQQKLASLPAPMARLKTLIHAQCQSLLPADFVISTPWEQLQHLPRYLKAMRLRLEKYPSSVERDQRHEQAIQTLVERWQQHVKNLQQAHQPVPPAIAEFRWLLEELRVSLFAQELKTPFPVSVKRLEKLWNERI